MDAVAVLPRTRFTAVGPVSGAFAARKIDSFRRAAEYVKNMPYGYHAGPEDILTALRDGYGTCTTKHALIAGLAREIGLPVHKTLGLYPMDVHLVNGIDSILRTWNLPFVPALHCFLSYGKFRVDLTEGNCTGKNYQLEDFIYTRVVPPLLAREEEERLYDHWCGLLLSDGGPFNASGTDAARLRSALSECKAVLKAHVACPSLPKK